MLSPAARHCFPYSVECKNVERLNVWDAYQQACDNAGGHEPLLIIKKNHKEPLAVGKSWDFHVDVALGISNEENLENISESAKHFIKEE